jgi:ABC-type lipoprotein release transport system permease subunit
VRPRSEREFLLTPGDIYLGEDLSEKLDARLDDRVVVTIAPPGGGDPRAAAFIVRGTFRTGVTEVDRGMVHVDIDDARSLLGLSGVVTQVALLLSDQEDVPKVTNSLRRTLAARSDVIVRPWQEALKELHDAIVLDDASAKLMMGVIFVIVTLGIFNTILMSVTERTKELGVQKALGTSGSRIFTYVLLEAAILAAFSAAAGLALGLTGHFVVSKVGINVSALLGDDYQISGIAFSGYIYSRLTVEGVVQWTLVTIGLVLASAVYPALRASKMIPVEAMRHV